MKFVVLMPWWVYAIFAFVIIAIGGAALYIGLLLFLIYLFFTRPALVLGLVLIGLSFRYWYVTIPILTVLFVYGYFKKKKESNSSEAPSLSGFLKDSSSTVSKEASDETSAPK